jgi:AraC-like DNA-binding protein
VDGTARQEPVHQRANVLVELPGLLRELGAEPACVFAGTDVDPATIDQETRVSFADLATLLERSVEVTGRGDLGLLLGERFVLGHHGLIGGIMATAPTLGEALAAFVSRQPGYSSGTVVYLHSEGGMTAFGKAVCSTSVRPGRTYTDLVLTIGARMVGFVTGGAAGLAEVHLGYRRPSVAAPYGRIFGAPVRFGQPLSCLYLPTGALATPLPGRDAALHARLAGRMEEALRGRAPTLGTLVRGALRKLILVGKPTMEAVAGELAMHPRTLRRRLKEDGFVFEDLRDEVRLASALELLELTDLSVGDVAATLAYASPEVFSEAFRRMRGASPREWRAEHARRN